MSITTLILAQAIEDILRFELGLPLVGTQAEEAEDAYYEALSFVARYPKLLSKVRTNSRYKKQWLKEVEDARPC